MIRSKTRSHSRLRLHGVARVAVVCAGAWHVSVCPGAAVEPFPTGRLVENITCLVDSTQTYTLFLPAGYTPPRGGERTDRRWPALLVFDPRGRSVRAARIFHKAVARYGWIVLSSNDTRSDGPWEPNVRALEALWPEIHTRYRVDPKRIYAAGFSGGVLVAWYLAQLAKPHSLAGIFSAGGRPAAEIPVQRIEFAHFGTAGHRDFNFLAMRELDDIAAASGAPHQLRTFVGRHQWMPEALASEGVEWMEILAMKHGLRPRDPVLSEQIFQRHRAGADSLRARGRLVEAHRGYVVLADTWEGMRNVSSVRRTLASLENDTRWKAQREAERRARAFEISAQERLAGPLQDLTGAQGTTAHPHWIDTLEIDSLIERARDESDLSQAAQRVLEWVFARTSFYIHQELVSRGDLAHAIAALRVALRIHPNAAHVWYHLARAHAQTRDAERAVDALLRAIELGYASLERVENDVAFTPIREHHAYTRAVNDLRREATGEDAR